NHIATLYLNDLGDVIRDAADPRFEFVRYAESLAASQPTFDYLHDALNGPSSLVDASLRELTLEALAEYQPTLVLIRAVSRQRVRRISNRSNHQADAPVHRHRSGWRVLQHRAARNERAARVRLLRLR